jgi:hypothetical protein
MQPKSKMLRWANRKALLPCFWGSFKMLGNDVMVRNDRVSDDTRPIFSDGPDKRQFQPMWRAPVAAAVLDMGEASREQGFRLNGCR